MRRRLEEDQLIRTEPQRRTGRCVELAQGEALDEPVAGPAHAGGAVDELGHEGPVALVEIGSGQHAGQDEVGVGTLAVDAQQRIEGHAPSGHPAGVGRLGLGRPGG